VKLDDGFSVTRWVTVRLSRKDLINVISDAVKGKALPLQAWRGPWGSKRLRLQNF
jgi:hypothetical protein